MKQCIICKCNREDKPLHYLCHWRVNNLMSAAAKRSYPIELVTTCGHLIHEHCLNATLRAQRLNAEKYNCFVCSSNCNIIIDASEKIEGAYHVKWMEKVINVRESFFDKNENIKKQVYWQSQSKS